MTPYATLFLMMFKNDHTDQVFHSFVLVSLKCIIAIHNYDIFSIALMFEGSRLIKIFKSQTVGAHGELVDFNIK